MTDFDISALDVLYRVLLDSRRRALLRYLRQHSGERVPLDRLVDVVRQQESASSDPNSVAMDLYHHHLPLMADAGLIHFDSDHLTVRYVGREADNTPGSEQDRTPHASAENG